MYERSYLLSREQLCKLLNEAYMNGYHCGWSDGEAEDYVDGMLAEAGIHSEDPQE